MPTAEFTVADGHELKTRIPLMGKSPELTDRLILVNGQPIRMAPLRIEIFGCVKGSELAIYPPLLPGEHSSVDYGMRSVIRVSAPDETFVYGDVDLTDLRVP